MRFIEKINCIKRFAFFGPWPWIFQRPQHHGLCVTGLIREHAGTPTADRCAKSTKASPGPQIRGPQRHQLGSARIASECHVAKPSPSRRESGNSGARICCSRSGVGSRTDGAPVGGGGDARAHLSAPRARAWAGCRLDAAIGRLRRAEARPAPRAPDVRSGLPPPARRFPVGPRRARRAHRSSPAHRTSSASRSTPGPRRPPCVLPARRMSAGARRTARLAPASRAVRGSAAAPDGLSTVVVSASAGRMRARPAMWRALER